MLTINNKSNKKKIPKIFQNISGLTILNKLNSLDNNKIINKRTKNKVNRFKKDKKKFHSLNNKNNLTYNQLYIPKDNILRILVKYYNKNEINKTQNIIAPLRNKIYDFQEKHDKISKEIEDINKETKPFINRYKLSGLLAPKNNSQFLKLGVDHKVIDKFNYLGYNINDIINRTNIFDKSLLLNKQYDNFVKYVSVSKDSELLNDSNYISKINDGLISKKNSELFEINKIYDINRKSKNNIFHNEKQKKQVKISRIQLSKTFNDINNTLKVINERKFLKEEKIESNNIKNTKDNVDNIKNDIKNLIYSINNLEKENNKDDILNKENFSKKIINGLTPNNETANSFMFNSLSLSSFSSKNKTNYIINLKRSKNRPLFSSDKNFTKYNFSSLSLPTSLKKIKIKENDLKLRSSVKFKKINDNLFKQYSLYNKNNSENKINENDNPKNIFLKNYNSEKRKSKIEEYNNIKHNFLQRLYKNIQLKSFSENKKDISDYLQIFKGTNIREPNFEKGSKLYNLINDFLSKSSSYNLPHEIDKIRSKTNVFDYKKSFQFDSIKKLNAKIKDLIYDCAEDILDLNNDIKK